MILVDSCVLIDVFNRDPEWFDWSRGQLARAASGAYLAINPIVTGEICWRFESLDQFQAITSALLIGFEPLDMRAGYFAGVAFRRYRERRGPGTPKRPLPDFLIGGHALFAGATILTRDPRFYRAYFPDVPLITPETDHG
ncbi:type II toxin-antitoxin system VapC family toxin [Sphingomonas sp. CJ20]